MYFKILVDANDLERIDECIAEWIRSSFDELSESRREQYKETHRRVNEQWEDQQKK